ncbi:hypothetical protein CYLTODRAFT_487638 [Cylindrobasidium torrendii FP15055 ss-10]|uniref:Uncharacterized protein n=1 Tax=Cylindrobasidium torrendii FP15055 ss-10 TaxID=1314674 RepID=A0A0D7BKK8_9AGAR|nr:hypothetical protein CYLTODRAFT_487638 [Cylindrobasidium torrendii FP15055 ss-10]
MADYSPKQPLSRGSSLALQAGAVGTMVAALRNALGTHPYGAMGIITHTGSTIGLFAAAGFTYGYTKDFVANQRQKDDPINAASGACAAAFLGGLRTRSLPVAVTGCAVMGAAVGAFEYVGKLSPENVESKEDRRKKFFKSPPNFIIDPAQEST